MTAPSRYQTVLILLITLVAICLGVMNLGDRASWQQAADGVQWVQSARGVEAESVEAGSLIQPGDLLSSINDVPVGSLDDLTRIHEFLAESLLPGSPATYQVQDAQGRAIQHKVLIQLRSGFRSIDVLLAVAAFGFLGIGLFIFLRNWSAAGALHFYVICLVAFILFLFRHSGQADTLDLVVYWANAVAFLLLPALFFHFCLYFPQPAERLTRQPSIKFLIYLPTTLAILFHAAWFLGWLRPIRLPRTETGQLFVEQVELIYFVAILAAGGAILMWKRHHLETAVQRQQMKWITRSTISAVALFSAFYGVPYLYGVTPTPMMESSVLALLLIPIGFGYAINRYRLMDVDLIFKQSAAYVLASSLLLGLYVATVLGLGQLVETLSGQGGMVVFGLAALLLGAFFAPLKNLIQEQIDRTFYRDRYDYRKSLSDFGRTLGSEVSLVTLADKISERIHSTLDVQPIGLFLRDEPQKNRYTQFRVDRPGDGAVSPIEASDEVLRSLGREPGWLLPNFFSASIEKCRDLLAEHGYRYVQPLEVHERVIGFIALGTRRGGKFLTSDDLQLVSTLAGYAAIAIDNARLYRSLETNAAKLAELKAYNENVIESISVGVAVISQDETISLWNNRLESIYGVAARDALGRPAEEIFPQRFVESLRTAVGGRLHQVSRPALMANTRLNLPGGGSRIVNVTVTPFVTSDHLSAGTLLVIDDITEKSQLESQLQQAEKLSSIGLFAAGVAHEVNTPLAGISSYAQMLIDETDDQDPQREVLRRIEQQSFRASEIVNNLLKFARVSDTDFEQVNLNTLMLETVSLLDHPLRNSGIDVNLELDPALPPTIGSGGKLQQVFMNLFLNARDAMPKGGGVRVRTYAQESALVVEITDEGEGISPENIKRIYDPFFTTKEVGKGTGLGLAVSYGIVKEHAGRINVDSRPGHGTTFTLEFPIKRVH